MKHLLRGVALVALFAVIVPAWAQAPNTSPAPPSSSPASAAPEKAAAAPEAKAETKAEKWVQPRPHRQVRRSHRYARYRSPPYGSRYYWDHRWMSPADHAANDLNAYQMYGGGWGWGRGTYSRMPYTCY
jgi:hypothetical protein